MTDPQSGAALTQEMRDKLRQLFKSTDLMDARLTRFDSMIRDNWQAIIGALDDHDAQSRRIEELQRALASAINALRSYQYGNASPELAQEVADHCAALAREAVNWTPRESIKEE